MFRSLMTIIRELYLYLTKVIFMLKHPVKLRRYIYWVMWQHVVENMYIILYILPINIVVLDEYTYSTYVIKKFLRIYG